jgi:hypothetical protein
MARSFTLLVVLRHQLVRADFDAAREPVLRSIRRESPVADQTLAERIERLAETGGKLATETFVLTDDAFRQSVDLDARALRGLAPHDVANAIACEAQLYSGVAAQDAALAYVPRRGDATTRSFDVLELARAELDDVAGRVRALGSRLRGLRHPAGLPHSMGDAATPGRFVRVERWADVTAIVESKQDGSIDVATQRGTKPIGGAFTQTAGADAERAETLFAPGISPTQTVGTLIDLSRDDALDSWLRAWAKELSTREDSMSLRPRARPWTTAHKVGLAVGLAFVVALACFLDRGRLREQRTSLGEQLVTARAPIDTLARLRDEATRLDGELRALRGTGLSNAREARAQWRPQVPASLLRALANRRPDGVLIDALRIGWKGGRIDGYAADLRGVEQLLTLLDEILLPFEFEVVPKSSRRLEGSTPTGPYAFDVDLQLGAQPAPAAEHGEDRS